MSNTGWDAWPRLEEDQPAWADEYCSDDTNSEYSQVGKLYDNWLNT